MRTGLARTLTGAATAAFLATGVLTAPPALAAQGDITTIAGGPGGPFRSTEMDQYVVGLALTPSRVWIADWRILHAVALRTIDRATGIESAPLLAMPEPGRDYSWPTIAPERNGNVLVAYNGPTGGIVVDVSPTGQTRRVAGGGAPSKSGIEGLPATAGQLATINGIAVSDKGVIYLSFNSYANERSVYTTSSRIGKIGTEGRLTTYAGALGGTGYGGDGGPAALATFNTPKGLALDPAGNLYVADTGNQRVRRISPGSAGTAGTITTVHEGFTESVGYDAGGLYFGAGCRIQRLDAQGLTTVAGTGACGSAGDDGPALAGTIAPSWLSVSGGDIAFVQEPSVAGRPQARMVDGGVLRSLTRDSTTDPLAAGDGGPALQAQLAHFGQRTAVDAAGNVYVTYGNRLRKITPDGTITTVAGTGAPTTTDTGLGGPATAASLRPLTDVAIAPNGDLYLGGTDRIYRVDATGTIDAVVGDGTRDYSADGTLAVGAHMAGPKGMALDPTGALVFGEGCHVRRVDAAGLLTTLAGTASACGVSEDGAVASEAALGWVHDIAVDSLGRVLFVDEEQATWQSPRIVRVRRVELDGRLISLAGGGTSEADGVPATQATIWDNLMSLTVDALGRPLITELSHAVVRRVALDGTISTVIGGGAGPDGGPAKGADLVLPWDTAVGANGDLYVTCTDGRTPYGGGAIRKVSQA